MSPEAYVIEAGAGRPLVLLHAFPLNASMWAPQRQPLGNSYLLVCPDLCGFGGSTLPAGEPNLDAVADDVAAMLDARRITEPVALGGLSMGGYVAMAFWRRYPERVAALILADTKATADSAPAAANRERIATEVVAARSSAQLVAELLSKLIGTTTKEQRPLVTDRVKALIESAPPDAVAWAQRAMAARPDSLADLGAVDVPTLVIVGAQDELSSVSDATAMVDAIPRARLVTIESAGHLSSMEAPEAFTAALLDFLAALPR